MRKKCIVFGLIAGMLLGLVGCNAAAEDPYGKDPNQHGNGAAGNVVATTAITVEAPNKISFYPDGETAVVSWTACLDATGYQMDFMDQTYDYEKTASRLRNLKQGKEYEIRVRAVRSEGGKDYYSDWTSATYTVPEINYEDIRWGTAIFLSANQAETWAQQMGYNVDRVTEDDITVVRISKEDPENKGALNKLGTIFEALVNGFVDGAVDSVKADYSSAETIIDNYLQSEGMKDYFAKEEEKAKYAGLEGAFANGWAAAWSSRDIVYEYYYEDTSRSPYMGTCYWLKNNRENFDQEFDYEKDKDGRMIVNNKLFGQPFYFTINEIEDNGLHKWIAVISRK